MKTMKKFIATALAAGALAATAPASAQDIGNIIGSILDFAGVTQPANSYYYDQYGRQVYIDAYGRHVIVQNATPQASTIVGYDAWGRPVYGNTTYSYGQYAYGGTSWDYDGDGISNSRDRWPSDSRFW